MRLNSNRNDSYLKSMMTVAPLATRSGSFTNPPHSSSRPVKFYFEQPTLSCILIVVCMWMQSYWLLIFISVLFSLASEVVPILQVSFSLLIHARSILVTCAFSFWNVRHSKPGSGCVLVWTWRILRQRSQQLNSYNVTGFPCRKDLRRQPTPAPSHSPWRCAAPISLRNVSMLRHHHLEPQTQPH